MCTPRFLWMPAHRMQIKTPRFQDAHLGPDKEKKALWFEKWRDVWRKNKHAPSCRDLKVPRTGFPFLTNELTWKWKPVCHTSLNTCKKNPQKTKLHAAELEVLQFNRCLYYWWYPYAWSCGYDGDHMTEKEMTRTRQCWFKKLQTSINFSHCWYYRSWLIWCDADLGAV